MKGTEGMTVLCINCGEVNAEGSKMCKMCGALLPKKGSLQSPQVRATSAKSRHNPARFVAVQYSGVGLRLFAWTIDSIILLIGITLILSLLGLHDIKAFVQHGINFHAPASALKMFAVFLGVTVLYKTVFEGSEQKSTIGKQVAGIKVTDEEGECITFLPALQRSLVLLVIPCLIWFLATSIHAPNIQGPLYLCYGLVLFGMIATRHKKQGLHDLIMHTQVIVEE